VIKGRVVIGTSGSEYGVRGYISAYDAETGQLAWRFYTVPGDPLAMAAKTWHGEWWKLGGGGTVWESIAQPSELQNRHEDRGEQDKERQWQKPGRREIAHAAENCIRLGAAKSGDRQHRQDIGRQVKDVPRQGESGGCRKASGPAR
jgi:hypothetical protein